MVEAIAANLAHMAAGIRHDWSDSDSPYRQAIATAGQGNGFFEGADEVSGKLLNTLHTQAQVIVEQKLDRPLGFNSLDGD